MTYSAQPPGNQNCSRHPGAMSTKRVELEVPRLTARRSARARTGAAVDFIRSDQLIGQFTPSPRWTHQSPVTQPLASRGSIDGVRRIGCRLSVPHAPTNTEAVTTPRPQKQARSAQRFDGSVFLRVDDMPLPAAGGRAPRCDGDSPLTLLTPCGYRQAQR